MLAERELYSFHEFEGNGRSGEDFESLYVAQTSVCLLNAPTEVCATHLSHQTAHLSR